MLITSNLESVIARQVNYGVYKPEEFVQSPYNTAYWSGHLIEEICEFLDCPVKEELAEAADVIIFLQNLSAYLYPTETLTIELKNYSGDYDHDIYAEEVIGAIRKHLPDRKSWKTYAKNTWENWLSLVNLVLKVISQNYFYGDIEKAYLAKERYNATRISTGDWA